MMKNSSIQNLKKPTKMKWLHMAFVLIFITSPSQGKLGRKAAERFVDTLLAGPNMPTRLK
jgi:hypothetical protein